MDMRKIYAELHNALRLFVALNGAKMTDEEAVSVSGLHDEWVSGKAYTADDVDKVVRYKDKLYRIVSAHTAQSHYPPDGEGLLALYRPIVLGYAGTTDDPIPFAYGMDVTAGQYYSYTNSVWLAKKDMKPCVWYPVDGNEWEKAN